MHTRSHARISVAFLLLSFGLASCNSEVGINTRHVQGFLEVPPRLMAEGEATPRDNNINDTIGRAEDAGPVGYRYSEITGTLDSGGSTGTGSAREYSGDLDFYRFTFGATGNLVIRIEQPEVGEDETRPDIDIRLFNGEGTLFSLSDDATNLAQVSYEGCVDEFFTVMVAAKNDLGEGVTAPYTLIVEGFDPNDLSDGMLVGAYLNSGEASTELPEDEDVKWEAELLGNPVAGSSVTGFQFDETTRTWWAPFDMPFPQQVVTDGGLVVADCRGATNFSEVDAAALESFCLSQGEAAPELGLDRVDNDCNAIADDGSSFDDFDGDGFAPAQGDCNDMNSMVGPHIEGDIPGDRIDNDCDGWADNGPDPQDNDGDGVTIAQGDCNDANPDIRPATGELLAAEIPHNLIDDNCNGRVDEEPPEDCADEVDNDEDELVDCDDEDCVDPSRGVASEDCGGPSAIEDNDGDGFSAAAGDCDDTDPTRHPHVRDGDGNIEEFFYDVSNGIDDDCDGAIDENYVWDIAEDGSFVQLGSYREDQDGDGYSLYDRDCNDTDASSFPGNYELERVHRVNEEISQVYVLAGTFPDLNSATVPPGSMVNSRLQPIDLDTTRATWQFMDDWFGDQPGQVEPLGLPTVELDVFVPSLFGQRVAEVEPNDAGPSNLDDSQDLGLLSEPGLVDRIDGTIETIVPNSDTGDQDWYFFETQEDGFVNVRLDWGACDPDADPDDTSAGEDEDFDALLYCYYGDAINPFNWYVIDNYGASTLAKPEISRSVVQLPRGTQCQVKVNGWNGTPGPYDLRVWLE